MKSKGKIYLNPKPVFVFLSIILGVFIVVLLPALYKIISRDHPEGIDIMVYLPNQFLLDSILGILAGIIFSIVGLSKFNTATLVRLIRGFLTIIIMLAFLLYITIKSLM